MSEHSTLAAEPATDAGEAAAWVLPGPHGDPASCLQRIRYICQRNPDLYAAVATVVATHQGVPRDRLAEALRMNRAELQAHAVEDLVNLLKAAWNGGRDGFEAVLRTRKNSERKTGALPFIRPD
jgi:hypothetical protein